MRSPSLEGLESISDSGLGVEFSSKIILLKPAYSRSFIIRLALLIWACACGARLPRVGPDVGGALVFFEACLGLGMVPAA